jgi:hypothetical protein
VINPALRRQYRQAHLVGLTPSVSCGANSVTLQLGTIAAYLQAGTHGINAMNTAEASQDHQAVTRLFELSQSGDVENAEFAQLGRQVYESMFETYQGNPRNAESGSID